MVDNIERVGVEFVVEGVGRFVGEVSRAEKAYDSAVGKFSTGGKGAASAMGGMAAAAGGPTTAMIALATAAAQAAVKIGEAFVKAIGKAISSAADLAKTGLMLAGTFQEMEFAAIAIGRAMGVTTDETRAAIGVLNEAGIRYDVAAKSVAQLTRNQIDLSKASELARIAQATGILVGEDSSATMDRLTYAITTGNTVMLRRMGIFSDAKKAEEAFAETLGIHVDALTQQQRMQARVNDLIENSSAIMGVYDAAMQSPTKQLRSLTGRIIPEFLASLGAPFQSAFFTVVKSVSNFVVSLKEAVSEGGALYPVMVRIGAAASLLADGFKNAIDRVIGFVQGFRADFLGGLASTAEGALRWGVNIAAQLASGLIQGAASAITAAVNFISNLLSSWFAPGSPPKVAEGIDKWGAATMTEYLKGFTEADFSVLNKVQATLKRILTSGAYADISKDLIAAIGAGQFDEAIYDKIAKAAGKYGDEVAKLAKAQWELAQAEKDVAATEEALEEAREALEDSQGAVKGLTNEYNDLLRAGASDEVLKAKLAEINAAEKSRDAAVEAVKEAEEADEAARKRRDELAEQARLQGLLVDELLEMQEAQEGSAEALKGVGKGLKDVAKGLKGVEGLGGLMAMPEPVELGEGITDSIGEAIEGAKALLEEKFADIFAPLTDAWEEAKPALDEVTGAFTTLWENLQPVWAFIVDEVVPSMAEGWGIIRDTGTEAWETVSGAIEDAKLLIGDALGELGIDFTGLGITWDNVKERITTSIAFWAEVIAGKIHFAANIFAAFVRSISFGVNVAVRAWAWLRRTISTVVTKAGALLGELVTKVQTKFTEVYDTVRNKLTDTYDAFVEKWGDILREVGNKLRELKRKIVTKMQEILDKVREKLTDWIEVGKGIVQGIIDGVGEMYEELKAKIRRMADDILKWFKAKFGVECPDPSPVTAEVGKGAVEGFIKGLEDAARVASFSVDSAFAPIGRALLATGGVASAASQPVASQSIYRTAEVSIGPVTIQSGMDEAGLQYMVEDAVMRALRR